MDKILKDSLTKAFFGLVMAIDEESMLGGFWFEGNFVD
jgi:hypothetical protein